MECKSRRGCWNANSKKSLSTICGVIAHVCDHVSLGENYKEDIFEDTKTHRKLMLRDFDEFINKALTDIEDKTVSMNENSLQTY